MVFFSGDESNRRKWWLSLIKDLSDGRDRVVRAVKSRAGKSFLERPLQHLSPLELQPRSQIVVTRLE